MIRGPKPILLLPMTRWCLSSAGVVAAVVDSEPLVVGLGAVVGERTIQFCVSCPNWTTQRMWLSERVARRKLPLVMVMLAGLHPSAALLVLLTEEVVVEERVIVAVVVVVV